MYELTLRDVTPIAVAVRIAVAIIAGGLIGLERGMKNRPAGMRTYMVVCLGACLIMLTNQYVCQVFKTGDPVRMGAQVVSGIGFLGAGTIIVTRRNQIKGLTTAAGLWAAAGVGLAVGIGFYEAAVIGFAHVGEAWPIINILAAERMLGEGVDVVGNDHEVANLELGVHAAGRV